MDMVYALILLVIGMGVVYLFLYIMVWVMRGLKYFERLPGFKEPRPISSTDDAPERKVTTGQDNVGGVGEEQEVVAAVMGAYMVIQDRRQGTHGPSDHAPNDQGQVRV